jgi:DNA invertase Pin-like site-specific DNA recombinase
MYMDELANTLLNTNIISDTIIYARSSTKNQNNEFNNSASHSTQVAMCEQYCESNNLSGNITVQLETCSARQSNPLKQKKLLNIINTHTNCNLVCYDVSRFNRSNRDGTELIYKCIEKKISVHFVRENLVVTDNIDMYRFSTALISAQSESDAISARVKASINYRKSQGTFNIREKFGYNIIRDVNNKKSYETNELEQSVITIVLKLYFGCMISDVALINLGGYKDNCDIIEYGQYYEIDIASILNANNILNKSKRWTRYAVEFIIEDNDKYILDKDTLVEKLVLEIVDKVIINKKKNIRLIKDLYEEINGYELIEESDKQINAVNTMHDLLKFLNRNKVNFRFTEEEHLSKIISYYYVVTNNVVIKRKE